ncbi:MAG: hypothetical protein II397_06975, partial [Treponema sp.]|nr:hypothetical protein [Treponema sp.]
GEVKERVKKDSYPLTGTQTGIYVESMKRDGEAAYNNPILLKLDKSIDMDKLKDACEKAVAAHPFIKVKFKADEEGNPRQYRNDHEPYSQTIEKISEAELAKLTPDLMQPFRLLSDRLFRIRLFETEEAKYLFTDLHHIIFDGASMLVLLSDIERAYNLGVGTITLESFLHATYLEQVVKSSANPHPQGIIVRLTNGCQFGMNEECVRKSIALLKDLPGIKIQGIHFFTGTQKKMKKVAEEVAFIQGFCSELQKEFGIAFERIEYGPGLAFDYFSPDDYAQNFDDLKEFSAMIKDSPFFWVVESGRYVASSCGTYVSSVMDLKQNAEVPALFIDGGINHVNYYGQIMGMKKPPIHLVKTNSSQSIQGISTSNGYTIYGSLCTTADIITKEYPFDSQPGVGDLLSFANIGAYSVTEGIYLFLSHPLPKILSCKNGTEKLLRDSVESWRLNTSGGAE